MPFMTSGQEDFYPLSRMGPGVPSAPQQQPMPIGYTPGIPPYTPGVTPSHGTPTYGTPIPGVPGHEWIQPLYTPAPSAQVPAPAPGPAVTVYETPFPAPSADEWFIPLHTPQGMGPGIPSGPQGEMVQVQPSFLTPFAEHSIKVDREQDWVQPLDEFKEFILPIFPKDCLFPEQPQGGFISQYGIEPGIIQFEIEVKTPGPQDEFVPTDDRGVKTLGGKSRFKKLGSERVVFIDGCLVTRRGFIRYEDGSVSSLSDVVISKDSTAIIVLNNPEDVYFVQFVIHELITFGPYFKCSMNDDGDVSLISPHEPAEIGLKEPNNFCDEKSPFQMLEINNEMRENTQGGKSVRSVNKDVTKQYEVDSLAWYGESRTVYGEKVQIKFPLRTPFYLRGGGEGTRPEEPVKPGGIEPFYTEPQDDLQASIVDSPKPLNQVEIIRRVLDSLNESIPRNNNEYYIPSRIDYTLHYYTYIIKYGDIQGVIHWSRYYYWKLNTMKASITGLWKNPQDWYDTEDKGTTFHNALSKGEFLSEHPHEYLRHRLALSSDCNIDSFDDLIKMAK